MSEVHPHNTFYLMSARAQFLSRLKLRCDRKLPCSSCIRRGCQSICPNGALSGGQGTRFVLADTEELHLKLIAMSERIRDLENALDAMNAANNSGPHALLCNDLKAIKYVAGYNIASEDDIPRHTHDPFDSFGALKISDDGENRFLGPSAGSEGILLSEVSSRAPGDDKRSEADLPPRLYELARMWPFTPVELSKDDIRLSIETHLPTPEHANELIQSYLTNVVWCSMPVCRQQIVDELLPSIYTRANDTNASTRSVHQMMSDNHELALLLMVFACGAASDHSREPKNDEGQLYYHLARIALCLQPIFESVSLSTVQTLVLLALYDVVAIRKDDLEESWKMVFLAAVIAGSIGLHRDPGRWNLSPKIIERRRRVFWEMYLICNWQCLAGGRPPPLVRSAVDVHLPQDTDAITTPEGKTIPGYKMWKLRFLDECVAPVVDRLCADSRPLKYYEIVNFDRKIREFDDIEILRRVAIDPKENDASIPLSLRNRMTCYKSFLRQYLHRNFFGKAISDYPDNPCQPPFGMSFMTVFNNAVSVLDMLYQERTSISDWIIHFWTVVAHALESGYVVGCVAARCPRTCFAEPALKRLETAIELFGGIKHPVAKNGLPVLLRLREKARQAMYPSSINGSPPSRMNQGKEELDELSILRGSSRLVARSSSDRHSTSGLPLPVSQAACITERVPEMGSISMPFVSTASVQAPAQAPAVNATAPEEFQLPPGFDANAFNWDDVLARPVEQALRPVDLATSIGVDDKTFASLVPDTLFNASEFPQSWAFEGEQFIF